MQVVNLNQKIFKIHLKYRLLMLVCSIILAGVGLLALIIKGDGWLFGLIFFLVLALLALVAFICCSLWKIEIKDDGLIYQNYLGRKKSYKFADLKYREHPNGWVWYFLKDGKKVICIENLVTNCEALKEAYYTFTKKSKIETEEKYD